MNDKAHLLAALIVLSAVVLCGCDGDGPALPRRNWKTLYRHLAQNPTTLDPALVKDVAGGRIIAHIYGTLVTYDADGRLVGDVAESYSTSSDGRIYTFRIRKGLCFANGTPLTAEDVRFSFERTLSGATRSPRTWVLDRIKGAGAFMRGASKSIDGLRVIDDHTLVIELETPFAPFLGLLTMPAAAVVPHDLKKFPNAAFGSGPFRLASYRANEQIVLERNPLYRGPGPEVDRVTYKIIAEGIARLAEFRRGLIDIMDVPGDYYDSLSADARMKTRIVRTDSFNVYFLGINHTTRFSKAEFRKALASSLDVDMIVRALFRGRATRACGPIPPGIPGFDPEVKPEPYDLPLAKKLLVDSGFNLNEPVRFLCGSDKETVKICKAIKGELEKAGFRIELNSREKGTFKKMLRSGDFDIYYYSWWADYPDAENFLAPLFLTSADRGGANPTAYSRAVVDKKIRLSQAEVNDAKRNILYRDIQQLVKNDYARVWLWHKQELTLRQDWVKGYNPSPIYNTDKGNLIRIEAPSD